eukprot:TRINITY_DN11361_c0_g1_i3.p1 TRINITY_DN11361_c0_g1~~TRINITY_DN11361_c0_g1_i3.p1  ORF type:complete len:146 (+),score=31.17 TRINITY_DN11361_c0_g1_i3:130-567(+)
MSQWLGYAGGVAISIVISEVGKVQINQAYGAVLQETSLKELIAAGGVALYRFIRTKQQGSAASTTGEVPWLVILFLAAFKVQWSIWRDAALSLAPNSGIAKNVINLNSGLALAVGYFFLGQKLNRNMVLGTGLATAGAYISTVPV